MKYGSTVHVWETEHGGLTLWAKHYAGMFLFRSTKSKFPPLLTNTVTHTFQHMGHTDTHSPTTQVLSLPPTPSTLSPSVSCPVALITQKTGQATKTGSQLQRPRKFQKSAKQICGRSPEPMCLGQGLEWESGVGTLTFHTRFWWWETMAATLGSSCCAMPEFMMSWCSSYQGQIVKCSNQLV